MSIDSIVQDEIVATISPCFIPDCIVVVIIINRNTNLYLLSCDPLSNIIPTNRTFLVSTPPVWGSLPSPFPAFPLVELFPLLLLPLLLFTVEPVVSLSVISLSLVPFPPSFSPEAISTKLFTALVKLALANSISSLVEFSSANISLAVLN